MSDKPRTAAQLQLNQNRRNAAATLKSKGRKGNATSVAALVRHRREGKSNDEFFDALADSAAEVVVTTTTTAPNTTAKKPRTSAQAAANQRRSNAIAALKEQGLKANATSVKRYINASGAAAAPVVKKLVKAAAEIGEAVGIEEGREEMANAVVEAVSGHVAAGKKAANSEKGAAWLRNVKSAKNNLNRAFAESGLTRKSTRANAMRYAKTLRNTPNKANNLMMNILATAQGENFNKNTKSNKNKTIKKNKISKKNNSLGRKTRNYANRRRNRITRKKQAKYGTFNTSRRNNLNNQFQGSPTNFNIGELRNAPFNSAQ